MSFAKGYTPWNKGKIGSNKGKKFSDTWKANLSKSHKGKSVSLEARQKISQKLRGNKSHLYKDGRSSAPGYRGLQSKNNTQRRKLVKGFHTMGEWEDLKAKYNWTCPRCGRKESEKPLSKDHIIPISKGGSNNIENIQPLCRPCNSWKHTKIIKFNLLSEIRKV